MAKREYQKVGKSLGRAPRKASGRSTAPAGFAEHQPTPSRATPKPITAWALVTPKGRIMWENISNTRSSAVFDLRHEAIKLNTAEALAAGWRIVRVIISEESAPWTEPAALRVGDYVTALANPANEGECEPVMRIEIVAENPLRTRKYPYCTGGNRWFTREGLRMLPPHEIAALGIGAKDAEGGCPKDRSEAE